MLMHAVRSFMEFAVRKEHGDASDLHSMVHRILISSLRVPLLTQAAVALYYHKEVPATRNRDHQPKVVATIFIHCQVKLLRELYKYIVVPNPQRKGDFIKHHTTVILKSL